MKHRKVFLFVCCVLMGSAFSSEGQQTLTPEVQKMQQNAQNYLQQRDFANSIMLLNQAIRLAPDNVALRRDLAYTYYLSGKPEMAKEVIEPVVKSEFADEPTYQVAAAIENVLGKFGRARNILKEGIRKYPHSGLLYNNLGNLYSSGKSDKAALQAWEDGIVADPGFGQNYYGAARMYHAQENYVWALVYGEIYLNLDSDPGRGNQIKKMMIEAYQALLTNGIDTKLPAFRANEKNNSDKETFEECFQKVLLNNASVVQSGLSTETLIMLRTRFLMEWEWRYAQRFPFTLFSWQDKMIHSGYFDAYNQWLFGAVNSSQSFQLWVKKNAKNYSAFETWKRQNPLQPASYDPKP